MDLARNLRLASIRSHFGGRLAAIRFTTTTPKLSNQADVVESSPTFEHPSKVAVDPNSVVQGLTLTNAMKCPFLNEVSDQLHSDQSVAIAAQNQGGVPIHRMKTVIDQALYKVLSDLRSQRRYREFRYFRRAVGCHPEVVRQVADGTTETLINWCSNDYLNMAHDPVVLESMQRSLAEQGAGAGGTRNISGSNVVHIQLEEELAKLCRTESSLIFGSCYTANLGMFTVQLCQSV